MTIDHNDPDPTQWAQEDDRQSQNALIVPDSKLPATVEPFEDNPSIMDYWWNTILAQSAFGGAK